MESTAASKHLTTKRSIMTLTIYGLFLHPTQTFLGASPDHLVNYPLSVPSEGLLEIKCP